MNSERLCRRYSDDLGRAVALLFTLFGILYSGDSFALETVSRDGDWKVQGDEVIRDMHIRLNGSLILPAGTSLRLENCTLEILGDYSRHHSVEWKGGTLITKNCQLGGFVNHQDTAIHTVFHLYDGLWEATDTTVSYSYGISFHWSMGQGILRGTRLKAGPRPDAIILSGQAQVELIDSDFPIGLGVYCDQGGKTELKLLSGESITATYDRSNLLPGVNWKLTMTNTRVGRWFLFLRQIGEWQPPAKVTLVESKDLIVSLFNHNLKGEITLTNDLSEPLRMGNLTLRRAFDKPAGISMFAMYFSGDETDATIQGRTHICEWMQSGGTVRVRGLDNPQDLTFGCTTLELSGKAQLLADRVLFGRPMTWQPESSIGEANVKGDAKLIAKDISINGVRFRTEENGTVDIRGFTKQGRLEQKQDGGTIQLIETSDSADTAKPRVWVYTDMSDPTLRGTNPWGTITDYECSAIGQHGIVSGGPKGKEYFEQFRTSRLGTIFVDGKYVHDGVDHSDSATGVCAFKTFPPTGPTTQPSRNVTKQRSPSLRGDFTTNYCGGLAPRNLTTTDTPYSTRKSNNPSVP